MRRGEPPNSETGSLSSNRPSRSGRSTARLPTGARCEREPRWTRTIDWLTRGSPARRSTTRVGSRRHQRRGEPAVVDRVVGRGDAVVRDHRRADQVDARPALGPSTPGQHAHVPGRARRPAYDQRVATRWGELQAYAQLGGRPRPVNDAWIAACCLVRELPLATFNTRDFADFTAHEGWRSCRASNLGAWSARRQAGTRGTDRREQGAIGGG